MFLSFRFAQRRSKVFTPLLILVLVVLFLYLLLIFSYRRKSEKGLARKQILLVKKKNKTRTAENLQSVLGLFPFLCVLSNRRKQKPDEGKRSKFWRFPRLRKLFSFAITNSSFNAPSKHNRKLRLRLCLRLTCQLNLNFIHPFVAVLLQQKRSQQALEK